MRILRTALLISTLASNVHAGEWGQAERMKAEGIADILVAAKKCGFSVNDTAMSDWLKSQKMLSPEGLGYINNLVSVDETFGDKLTSTQCEMAKTSAKSIGVLSGD